MDFTLRFSRVSGNNDSLARNFVVLGGISFTGTSDKGLKSSRVGLWGVSLAFG